MSNFSSNLKYLVKRFATSQSELADYIGVKQTSVSNYINGKSEPDVSQLALIQQYFGISVDALITLNLEKEKLITDAMVADFKKGSEKTKIIGKRKPVMKPYPTDDVQRSVVNDPEDIQTWTILRQLKELNEKLDSLHVIAEKILKKNGGK